MTSSIGTNVPVSLGGDKKLIKSNLSHSYRIFIHNLKKRYRDGGVQKAMLQKVHSFGESCQQPT